MPNDAKPRRKKAVTTPGGVAFAPEVVPLDSLRPHPRNYNAHPADEVAHLAESIRANGVYRNVVVARDGTLLAGHGVVLAARSLGMAMIPVIRLDLDPDSPRALKVLAGDNEIAHLSEKDDRALSELLKQIGSEDEAGLLGTGYDEAMLANLVFVTRPAGEIGDFDEAAEWAGMPEYEPGEKTTKVVISFRNEDDLSEFASLLKLDLKGRVAGKTYTTWWPAKERQDLASVRFEG